MTFAVYILNSFKYVIFENKLFEKINFFTLSKCKENICVCIRVFLYIIYMISFFVIFTAFI